MKAKESGGEEVFSKINFRFISLCHKYLPGMWPNLRVKK